MGSFYITEWFGGTVGARVDSRPPDGANYFGGRWSAENGAAWTLLAGGNAINASAFNNARFQFADLVGTPQHKVTQFTSSIVFIVSGSTSQGGNVAGLTFYHNNGTTTSGSIIFESGIYKLVWHVADEDFHLTNLSGTGPYTIELSWDSDTGVSMIHVNGSLIGQNTNAFGEDYYWTINDIGGDGGVAVAMQSTGLRMNNFFFQGDFIDADVEPPDPPDTGTGYHGLVKDMVVVETLEHHDIPGQPYVPAKKAYYSYETQRVCGWVYQGTGHYIIVEDPSTGQSRLIWIPDGPGGAQAIWTCTNQQVRVYHPATPAIPAVPPSSYTTTAYESGYNLGWNSGGRSEAVFFGDSAVSFKVSPSAVGVIIGMNIDDGTTVDYNGNTIDYGFYCAHGKVRIMMGGVMGNAVGSYTDTTLFRIERVSDSISWQIDGSEVWYLASGAQESAGWLEAALYSGNDFVFQPKLDYTSDSTEDTTGTIAASFLPVTGYLSQGEHTEVHGLMAPMTAKMTSGSVVPSYTLINGYLTIFSGDFHSITGEVGRINSAMHPMEGLWSDHKYAAINAAMAPMDGWLLATEDAEHASFTSLTKAYGNITTKQIVIATFRSTGQLLGVFSADILNHAELMGRMTLGSQLSFTSQQKALLWSIAKTFDLAKVPEGDVETWVVNMEGGLFGSTQYQNYDYNSYATINGRHYGASMDGLVLLEGDTDDGEPIASVVSLGKLAGGSNLKKTFQECFLGVSGSGYMFVKVIAEGKEYIYKSRDWNPEMQTQRATFGKGLRTNYVTLEIYNGDGADFELDKVQFVVADMVRKI